MRKQDSRQTVNLVGATTTTDYAASVFVRLASGGRCSGSLVHERIVVTAWHCLPIDGSGMEVDAIVNGKVETRTVLQKFSPPGTFTIGIEDQGIDVAALTLTDGFTGVVPYPIELSGSKLADMPVRAVAFGGGSNLFGQKQTLTGTLYCDEVRDGFAFPFPMLTNINGAPGDSGGTLINQKGELVGTLSGMISGGCESNGTVHFADADDVWVARVSSSLSVVQAAFVSIGATPPQLQTTSVPDASSPSSAPDASQTSADASITLADSGLSGSRQDAGPSDSGGCAMAGAGSWTSVLLVAALTLCRRRRN
jgi:hypothetical protein